MATSACLASSMLRTGLSKKSDFPAGFQDIKTLGIDADHHGRLATNVPS